MFEPVMDEENIIISGDEDIDEDISDNSDSYDDYISSDESALIENEADSINDDIPETKIIYIVSENVCYIDKASDDPTNYSISFDTVLPEYVKIDPEQVATIIKAVEEKTISFNSVSSAEFNNFIDNFNIVSFLIFGLIFGYFVKESIFSKL